MVDRDRKGKFRIGHGCLCVRDPVTGQFTKKIVVTKAMTDQYAEVVKEVDFFLEHVGAGY